MCVCNRFYWTTPPDHGSPHQVSVGRRNTKWTACPRYVSNFGMPSNRYQGRAGTERARPGRKRARSTRLRIPRTKGERRGGHVDEAGPAQTIHFTARSIRQPTPGNGSLSQPMNNFSSARLGNPLHTRMGLLVLLHDISFI